MKLTSRADRRLAAVAALACCAILVPAVALAAPAGQRTPERLAAAPARPAATPSWKIVKTVRGGNNPAFTAVTATGRRTAWAFEATASAARIETPGAWRLSGSRWTRALFPGTAGEEVTSAASTSPDDVWAVVYNFYSSRTRVLSWDGRTWAVTRAFSGYPGEVVPLSPHDAWYFGSTSAWHYNARRWSRVPGAHGLADGSALSPDSIWAIGSTDVAHWNGRAWSRTSLAGLLPTCREHLCEPGLSSIYAQSPASVWAVGSGNRETIGGPVVLLHYNGHHWSRVALSSKAANPVRPVIPDGTAGLWIATHGFEFRPSAMLHYSGGHLRFAALPGIRDRVLLVTAVAAVPGLPRAIGVGETQPNKGTVGLNLRGVILTYGT